MKRIVGEYRGQVEGPVFIVSAGIHGNEHAGIIALERVFADLRKYQPSARGAFVGILGNLAAIREKKRFIDQDLNRMFDLERVSKLRQKSRSSLSSSEEREQYDLLRLFESGILQRYPNRSLYMMDLHTTSAKGGTFALAYDTPASRAIGKALGVSLIMGMEKVITGTTLDYFTQLKGTGIGFEAGQHEETASIDRIEAAIWVILTELGIIAASQVPDIEKYRLLLSRLRDEAPALVKFIYRHAVAPVDAFRMLPGFKNFDPVYKGQHLADSASGPVLCPEDGLMLMPLYQAQGQDGFFIVQALEHAEESVLLAEGKFC